MSENYPDLDELLYADFCTRAKAAIEAEYIKAHALWEADAIKARTLAEAKAKAKAGVDWDNENANVLLFAKTRDIAKVEDDWAAENVKAEIIAANTANSTYQLAKADYISSISKIKDAESAVDKAIVRVRAYQKLADCKIFWAKVAKGKPDESAKASEAKIACDIAEAARVTLSEAKAFKNIAVDEKSSARINLENAWANLRRAKFDLYQAEAKAKKKSLFNA